jgi:hypothetical protein
MTSNTLKHHCSVIGFYLLHQSFCWKSLKKDQYLKNKTLSYKHCLHMLIKCNFANALKLFNGCRHRHSRSTALYSTVRSKSQISTNIVYLVEHKTIQSFVLKLRLQVEIQLCNTSPFP